MLMTTTEKGNTNSAREARTVATKSLRPDHADAGIDPGELSEVFARQRAAFDRNPVPTLAERKAILRKLARLVEQNRLILIEAANADFGIRAAVETEMSEVVGTISIIRYMRHRLR